ncbi:MAG: hypothetical protein JNL96_06870 [Planctomycetaceae bacterium]|nr:hypothetical protein [Planctomycetaceae bacterium]
MSTSDWPNESWSRRVASNESQAAYLSGRLINCLEFHATQAYLLSLIDKDYEAEVQRNLVNQSIVQLLTIIRAGPLRSPLPIKVLRRLSNLLADKASEWGDDPVGEADHENAWNLLNDPDAEYELLSHERKLRDIAFYSSAVSMDEFCREIEESLVQGLYEFTVLGKELDSVVRSPLVYQAVLIYSEPEVVNHDGATTPAIRAKEDSLAAVIPEVPHEIFAQKKRRVGCRVCKAGDVAPKAGWARSLSMLTKSLIPALHIEADEVPTPDAAQIIESIDSAIWTHLDPLLPRWDRRRRRLSVNGQVIKDFHTQGSRGIQEAIIRRLDELGWPQAIDIGELIVRRGELTSDKSITDAITQLNRSSVVAQQESPLQLRFGKTEGRIFWSLNKP